MARMKIYLKQGTAYPSLGTKLDERAFDLEKYVRGEIKQLNVQAYDYCCGTTYNVTSTASVAAINQGLIYSASPAAVSLTLPLAADFNAHQGRRKVFTLDNTNGANTVTLVVNTGITASSVITGGTTLTVAAGTVGTFQLYFKDPTHALLARIA